MSIIDEDLEWILRYDLVNNNYKNKYWPGTKKRASVLTSWDPTISGNAAETKDISNAFIIRAHKYYPPGIAEFGWGVKTSTNNSNILDTSGIGWWTIAFLDDNFPIFKKNSQFINNYRYLPLSLNISGNYDKTWSKDYKDISLGLENAKYNEIDCFYHEKHTHNLVEDISNKFTFKFIKPVDFNSDIINKPNSLV